MRLAVAGKCTRKPNAAAPEDADQAEGEDVVEGKVERPPGPSAGGPSPAGSSSPPQRSDPGRSPGSSTLDTPTAHRPGVLAGGRLAPAGRRVSRPERGAVSAPGHPLALRSLAPHLRAVQVRWARSASASVPRPHTVPVLVREVLGLRRPKSTRRADGGEEGRKGRLAARS